MIKKKKQRKGRLKTVNIQKAVTSLHLLREKQRCAMIKKRTSNGRRLERNF